MSTKTNEHEHEHCRGMDGHFFILHLAMALVVSLELGGKSK
jgi:hypothetical protein